MIVKMGDPRSRDGDILKEPSSFFGSLPDLVSFKHLRKLERVASGLKGLCLVLQILRTSPP